VMLILNQVRIILNHSINCSSSMAQWNALLWRVFADFVALDQSQLSSHDNPQGYGSWFDCTHHEILDLLLFGDWIEQIPGIVPDMRIRSASRIETVSSIEGFLL
jgi:hypothetical protein